MGDSSFLLFQGGGGVVGGGRRLKRQVPKRRRVQCGDERRSGQRRVLHRPRVAPARHLRHTYGPVFSCGFFFCCWVFLWPSTSGHLNQHTGDACGARSTSSQFLFDFLLNFFTFAGQWSHGRDWRHARNTRVFCFFLCVKRKGGFCCVERPP